MIIFPGGTEDEAPERVKGGDITVAPVDTAGFSNLPRLLLHCCCAPCASYALEYLSPDYNITILFYNPNIRPPEEFEKRLAAVKTLLEAADYPNRVDLIAVDHDASAFELAAGPYRLEPEGGKRCGVCFGLRLEETAARAASGGYDCFATTLTVSPHKPAAVINEIGGALEEKYAVSYLPSDFKKRDGYKRSIELSKQYGLYRQSYCGCLMGERKNDAESERP